MAKQFIRWPGFYEERIPGIDPYALKILAYLFSKSFYGENGYTGVYYSSQAYSEVLNISKPNITERVKYLCENGLVVRKDKDLFLCESPGYSQAKSKPNELSSQKVNQINFSHNKVNDVYEKSKGDLQKSKPDLRNEQIKLTTFTSSPLYDRLEKGFESPLVLFKYLYSKITVVVVDDFVNFILNCHDFKWIKELRKMENKKPAFSGMQKNQRFINEIRWFHEKFAKADSESQKRTTDYKTMPIKDYIIYSFMDSILQDENPMGRFIKLCDDLKTSKKRIQFGAIQHVLDCEEAELAKVNLQTRMDNTNNMFGESSDWIATRKTEAEARKKIVEDNYENNPEIVTWASTAARVFLNVMGKKCDANGLPMDDEAKELYNRTFEVKFCKRLEGKE